MNRSEQRIRKNRIRRKYQRRRNVFFTLLTVCLVTVLSFTANGFLSNAKTDSSQMPVKYYKSIMVERGDTLWAIAAEYAAADSSTGQCLNEIRQLNSLHGDNITAGSYLVVPYYDAGSQ